MYLKFVVFDDYEIFYSLKFLFHAIRQWQINLMYHGSADPVFVTNKKKIKIVFVRESIKPGGRLCGDQYVVSLAESTTAWPQSRIAASFVVVTTVCLWRERPSTCSSPEVPGHSWAANFPSLVPSSPYYNCHRSCLLSSF